MKAFALMVVLGAILACSCAVKNGSIKPDEKAVVSLKVEVYATHWCPPCIWELDYLNSKGVKYTVYWIDEDEEKGKEMDSRCGSDRIPTNVITDKSGKEQCVIGFNKDKLDALLGL